MMLRTRKWIRSLFWEARPSPCKRSTMATGTQAHLEQGVEKAKLAPSIGRRKRGEGKPKRNFPCQDCQKAFNSLEKLKVHSYSHTGERPYCCSHPGCTKAFVSKYKLLRHTATHSPEKSHKCSYCEKMFHRKDHLKNHLHIHDPFKEAFACQECGKSYNTKLGFKRHLALHAAHRGDLTCQVCLQPFPGTAVLLDHLKSHAGKSSGGSKEKKHRCEHCERRFYTRKDVRRHMVVHTGRKDFLCQYCAQRFGRKDHLTRHVKKSHPQELLRVKTEPAELPEPPHPLGFYAGPVPDPGPFPNAARLTSYAASTSSQEHNPKGELESYLLDLQSGLPSSSSSSAPQGPQVPVCKLEMDALEESSLERSLSKMAASTASDPLASMDFSQLFNFLPLHGPLYHHAGAGEGQLTLNEDGAHLHPAPEPCQGPESAPGPLQSHASFICNLNAPTTLPRFHQAFQ